MISVSNLVVTTTHHYPIAEIDGEWSPADHDPLIVHFIERINAVAKAKARTTIFMYGQIVSVTYDKE